MQNWTKVRLFYLRQVCYVCPLPVAFNSVIIGLANFILQSNKIMLYTYKAFHIVSRIIPANL